MPGGAPQGNNNAGRGREATAALEKALHQIANEDHSQCIARFQALVDIWKAQIQKAQDGDTVAASMIVDRMEGKPRQSIDANITAREITDLTDAELGDIATSGSE